MSDSSYAVFLHNAATVLVMAPIAAGLAVAFGYALDAFDGGRRRRRLRLPPPIGHQCNTLVLGPGDYRFGDHWRLGLPLSIIVVVVGTPLIALFWPMAG